MERLLLEELKKWQNKADRRPLILRGARQVGTTWLLKEFGRLCFKEVCYINIEQIDSLESVFSGTIHPEDIINQLSVYHGNRIQEQYANYLR